MVVPRSHVRLVLLQVLLLAVSMVLAELCFPPPVQYAFGVFPSK